MTVLLMALESSTSWQDVIMYLAGAGLTGFMLWLLFRR